MPLLDRGFARRLSAPDAGTILQSLAAAHGGIDLFAMLNMPNTAAGAPNPFACMGGARPTQEPVTRTRFEMGPATVEHVVSKDTRKKLAKKARWLADLGPVTHRRAIGQAEIDAVLDAFFEQKARRSMTRGLPNPFADPQVRDFIRLAARPGPGSCTPGLELHALWCGDRAVATFGAATDGSWMSGSFISHEPEPALERCSPGEQLLLAVLRDAGTRGFDTFDLGVGGGAYKTSFCREPMPLCDVFAPVSVIGHAVAPVIAGAGAVKAAIKRDPRLLRFARRLAPLLASER
jgi:CelD/BcsL family acetyltransferase involved in cellulose biosynthesis